MMEAVVLYDYTAQESDELTLKRGDIVTNIQVRDGGWWEGSNKDGKRGLFPDNFVKIVSENFNLGSAGTPLCGKKFVVKFNYIPVNVDELELTVGDVVELISEVEEGWWEGRLNNKIGVFPSNFVSELPEPESGIDKTVDEESSSHTVVNHNEIIQDNSEKMEIEESARTSVKVSTTNDAPILPPKPKPVKEMCVALFPYEAKHDDELTLKENDTILLLSTDLPDKGWWKGQLNGKIGVFPDNFVKLIILSDDVSKPQRPSVTKMTTNKTRDNMNNKQATNSNVAALRKSLETPVNPEENNVNLLKKPIVLKKPDFSPSNSSDTMKNLLPSTPPSEKASMSSERTSINTSRNSSSSDALPSAKSSELEGTSWTETTVDSRNTRPLSSSINDKLNAELQNSFVNKEMDNTDGSSASKISRANNSDSHISDSDVDLKENREIDLNIISRSEVLTHPTASRAKAPKRRPPSGINFKEDDIPVTNNKIHNSKIIINGNASPKSAPWLQELKMNQLKKNSSQVNIRSGFTSTGSNVTFRFQRPVSMFSGDAEAHSLSFQPKSLPSSNESMPAVASTSITDTVTSSSFEKVVTVSVSDWNALLEKVNTLEIRLEKQNEYFTKTIDQLKSKLASEVSLRMEMKNEIDKLTELVTQV